MSGFAQAFKPALFSCPFPIKNDVKVSDRYRESLFYKASSIELFIVVTSVVMIIHKPEVYDAKHDVVFIFRQLSPTMRSDELTETTLGMRNVVTNAGDFWTAYEVIENGELGR